MAAATAPVSPDQITEAFPPPAISIDPPIGASDLAEATAPVPIDPAPEALPPPAALVEAVAGAAGATLRDAAPWLRRLGQWLLALLALYAVGWLLASAAPALTPFIIGL